MRKHLRIMIGLLLSVVLFASAFVLPVDVKAEVPDVQETAEYSKASSYYVGYEHYILVHNNTDQQLTITSSTVAYDATGAVSGTGNGYLEVLGPGRDGMLTESIHCTSEPVSYQTQLSSSICTEAVDIAASIVVQPTISSDNRNVVITCTNTGTVPTSLFEVIVLFMKDGKVIDSTYVFPMDLDAELKPGRALSDIAVCKSSDSPDSVLFYSQGFHGVSQ